MAGRDRFSVRIAALLAHLAGRRQLAPDVERDRALVRRALKGRLSSRLIRDAGGGEE